MYRSQSPASPASTTASLQPSARKQLPGDLRIGLAREVVRIDRSGGTVRLQHRRFESELRGRPPHQRAIDVEENKCAHRSKIHEDSRVDVPPAHDRDHASSLRLDPAGPQCGHSSRSRELDHQPLLFEQE